MSRNKRIETPVPVPQEPILPSVEVKRLGMVKYKVSLKLIPDQPFTHYGEAYEARHFQYHPHWDVLNWEVLGRGRAERKAKRMLSKYMRQIGYRQEDVVRYVGKLG